ncbi:MAG: NAD(P)-dependent oxidoreductase [Chloroflexota bacterium]
MKVLVTGGTGRVGEQAVARLVAHGHQVKVIGRRAELSVPGADYVACDITDFEALRAQVRGMEGIVHLAAVPAPMLASGHELFRINCAGTYNVYEAAAQEGIKRVVSASSINALGFFFGCKSFPLQYLPIDEAHPTHTTDPYSFSKQVVEEIAAYYWRREGISGVCLRLPGVYDGTRADGRNDMRRRRQEGLQALLALPPDERRAQVETLLAAYEQARSERFLEQPREAMGATMPRPDLGVMMGRHNFWAGVDARDSAQAIERGLLRDYAGSHPLYVNSDHNSAGVPSQVLAEVFFPDVPLRHPLVGDESLVSIARAQALLGFAPEYRLGA